MLLFIKINLRSFIRNSLCSMNKFINFFILIIITKLSFEALMDSNYKNFTTNKVVIDSKDKKENNL